MSLRSTYNALQELVKKYKVLGSVSALVEWDELVMMASKGASARAIQMSTLASLKHDLETDPKIGQYLSDLYDENTQTVKEEKEQPFNEFEISNIKLISKEYNRNTKIPSELVARSSALASKGYHTWVQARKDSDYQKFLPIMEEWIDIKKQMATLINPKGDIYDTLLDEFEPGLDSSKLTKIFEEVKRELIPFIQQVREKVTKDPQNYGENELLSKITGNNNSSTSTSAGEDDLGTFPIEVQKKVNRQIAEAIGYDFEAGRLDVSMHPFSTGISIGDVRITTRYNKEEFLNGLTGTIHETGHAMYEQGLNQEYEYQPVQYALGMASHEGQSLFWERHVALSLAFWKKWYSVVEEHFPELKKRNLSVEKDVYKSVNVVQLNNLIRVEADELTYPMHVIVRFEIEKALFDGTINVKDVPKVWNEKMKEYLGVEIPNDAKGCLQDVHWSSGAFGYFPTYLLGAMTACQIAHSLPNFENLLNNNDYLSIKQWLNENIHKKGSMTLTTDNLLKQATGEELNPKIFISYLKKKYTEVYDL
ncbi:hypothetical protein ABK040_010181 [Willaertia magna]